MYKKILAAILSAVLMFCLAACSADKNKDTKAEKTDITFCLEWTPNTNHTGLYVALQKGYYDEAGLNVQIVQPPENSAATQVCAAGQAQFTVEGQDTLAAAFTSENEIGVTAVATILQHNTSGIMSKAGSGMDKPAGLTGNTYLTWDSPIELAIMKNVVENGGGDWNKVHIIPNTVTEEAQDVNENPNHAIWVFYGWGGINAKVSGVDVDYFSFKDIDKTFDYYTPVIVGNNDFLKENPKATKAFMQATAKGYEYAAKHPEEAAQILIDSDDTGALTGCEELVLESQKWISEQYIADADKWGTIDSERWNKFYDWLWENKLIEKQINKDFGFTNEFLPQ
ncbi:MAG: ABC transporter substrate-binding protein [Eubacterium sp.]|nr:ABC transporter substrate-binding protein [Eubacterium sp.]